MAVCHCSFGSDSRRRPTDGIETKKERMVKIIETDILG